MTSFVVALREGLELSVALLLLTAVFPEQRRALIAAAVCMLLAGAALSWLNAPLPSLARKALTGYLFSGFVLLLYLSFFSEHRVFSAVSAVAILFFIPAAQGASVLSDEAAVKGSGQVLSAIAGIGVSAGFFGICLRFLPGLGLERFLAADGVMVVLASFSFLFGGIREFEHASIVTSIQQGVSVFLSSFIPFLRETLLIPGGGLVVTFSEPVFGYLASQRVAMAMTATLLFVPPLAVFLRLLLSPEPVTAGIEKKAERRRITAGYINELLKKGVPVLAALLVSIVQLHAANLALRPTYDPEPVPLVSEGDTLSIPLADRLGDIADGRMRKYSFREGGETYRFFVIMRPDGEVVAVLDACEICPPRGYVQRGDHVICTYCNTPIPKQTLGQPGGCNPIPVQYRVEGNTMTVSRKDVIAAFRREAGKETGSVLR